MRLSAAAAESTEGAVRALLSTFTSMGVPGTLARLYLEYLQSEHIEARICSHLFVLHGRSGKLRDPNSLDENTPLINNKLN